MKKITEKNKEVSENNIKAIVRYYKLIERN